MASDRTDSLIRQIFESAFNRGELDIVDDLVAADGVTHTARRRIPGSRMEIKRLIAALRAAFPDLHCTIENEMSEGDKQAAYWIMHGTHLGSYLGNRPTKRSINVQGSFFARIADGRMVEIWILFEELHLLRQLGLVPPL